MSSESARRTRSALTRRQALIGLLGIPVGILAIQRRRQGVGQPDWHRRVILSSDDASMCAAVNMGMMQAMKRGIVGSASIMACGPAFHVHEFADFPVTHPEFDYGVHLALTCDFSEQPWEPVLGAASVASLVNDDGLFPMWLTQSFESEEVRRELRAQIRRALNAGIRCYLVAGVWRLRWILFPSEVIGRNLLTAFMVMGLIPLSGIVVATLTK